MSLIHQNRLRAFAVLLLPSSSSQPQTGGAFTQLAPFLIVLLVEAAADLAVQSLDGQLSVRLVLAMQAVPLLKLNWHR